MRALLVSSLVVLVACGGSKKPADSPSETPSPDTSGSSSSDMPAPSDSATPAASAGAAPAAPSEAPPAESAPAQHPVPNVTGSIDGKTFNPKMGRINQPMQKDGRIILMLDERSECGGGDARPGEEILTLTVPWEDGYKQDIGSLKRAGKKGPAEVSFVRVSSSGKKDVSTTFKPSGRVTIAKAPTEQGSLGKVNIDLQSGDYMLSGDLDVQVCVDAKSAQSAQSAPKAAPKSPAKNPPTKKKKM